MNSSRGLRVLSVLLTGLFTVTVSMSAPASAASGIEETTGPETAAVPIDPELLELAEIQTRGEIEDLVESDQPLDTLYDPDAQSYVAARPAQPVSSPSRSPLGA